MGAEMDALHALMDELLTLPPARPEGEGDARKPCDPAFPEPADDGGTLFGEGSY